MLGILKQLHEAYGFGHLHLEELIRRAPYTYKIYTIPKKSGGQRIIAQPAKETKTVQRWVTEHVFSQLPIHDSSTAYSRGSSIKRNVLRHAKNPYLVKLDLKNFFNSINSDNVRRLLLDNLSASLTESDVDRIVQICCVKLPANDSLCLSVGAPSSPLLSNSMMFRFDNIVSEWCRDSGIIYSRYADDLTFSTCIRGISATIQPFIEQCLANLDYPRLQINTQKTVHSSMKFRRRVTGLIIANDNSVSLGRDRKREISALIDNFRRGRLSEKETYRLQGLLGLSSDVEPLFVTRMSAKYGPQLITDIFRVRKPKREIRTLTLDDILSGTFD